MHDSCQIISITIGSDLLVRRCIPRPCNGSKWIAASVAISETACDSAARRRIHHQVRSMRCGTAASAHLRDMCEVRDHRSKLLANRLILYTAGQA
jgi:hypothetical protein